MSEVVCECAQRMCGCDHTGLPLVRRWHRDDNLAGDDRRGYGAFHSNVHRLSLGRVLPQQLHDLVVSAIAHVVVCYLLQQWVGRTVDVVTGERERESSGKRLHHRTS